MHPIATLASTAIAPVIFLDLDGVLVIQSQVGQRKFQAYAAARRATGLSVPQVTLATRRAFVPAAVDRLNGLCAETGAALVLSSSWRTREGVRQQLHTAGVLGPFHDDWRTDSDGPRRSDEIQRWLSQHGRPPFVILDDWPAQLVGMLDRTVLTHFQVGLTAQDCTCAVALLAGGTSDGALKV